MLSNNYLLSLVAVALVVQCSGFAVAGDIGILAADPLSPKSVILESEGKSEWEIELLTYFHLAALNAEVGAARLTTDVGLEWGDWSNLQDEIDFATQGRLGVRKGKVGAFFDWTYLRLSDENATAGPLLRSVSIKSETVILDAALTYRVLESERGFLDVMAGARYWYLGEDVGINVDGAGIREFSRNASQRIVDTAVDRISDAVADAVARARPIVEERIRQEVDARIGDITVPGDLSPSLLQGYSTTNALGDAGSRRGIGPGSFQRERGDLIGAIIAERKAQALVKAGSLKASAQKKAQKKVAQAQKRLERAIEKQLRRLPSEVSVSQDWVDPYVGLIGRYNINDRLYLVGRTDIGGFGVGSDLAWHATGAIGRQMGERSALEVGYKHLAVDHDNGGFVFDGYMSGFFAGLVIELR